MGLAEAFAILPPDSFHMTVIDLVCDQVRDPAHWSSELPQDLPLDQVDAFMTRRLERITWPSPPEMRVIGLGSLGGDHTLRLILEPTDMAQASALQNFRDEASQATAVRLPTHDRYAFHVSLAYPLVILGGGQLDAYARFEQQVTPRLRRRLAEVSLGAPYLTLFPDMFSFPRVRPTE